MKGDEWNHFLNDKLKLKMTLIIFEVIFTQTIKWKIKFKTLSKVSHIKFLLFWKNNVCHLPSSPSVRSSFVFVQQPPPWSPTPHPPPAVSLWFVCGYQALSWWVGEQKGGGDWSGVVGIFSGHHQWGRRSPCWNMTGSQATTRRHRSLVSNLSGDCGSDWTAGSLLLFVVWTGSCGLKYCSCVSSPPCELSFVLLESQLEKENSCLCFLPPSVGYLPVTLSLYMVFLSRSLSPES